MGERVIGVETERLDGRTQHQLHNEEDNHAKNKDQDNESRIDSTLRTMEMAHV